MEISFGGLWEEDVEDKIKEMEADGYELVEKQYQDEGHHVSLTFRKKG